MEFEGKNEDEESIPEEKEVDNDENSSDRDETENDNEWSDIDWNEENSVEQQESTWDDIDWNEEASGEQQESIWNDINWEDLEADPEKENVKVEEDQRSEIDDFNDNEIDRDGENYDPYESSENNEQENYAGEFENKYASAMSTLLISEKEMYAYIREYVEAMLGNENEKLSQEELNQPDNIAEGPSELQQFLEQEKERIQLEQEQAELEKTPEIEPEANSDVNEEELEQELEKEVEPQLDSSEKISPNNEEELIDQEEQEKLVEPELEPAISDEEIEEGKEREVVAATTEEINEPELEQTKSEEGFDDKEVEREELQVSQEVEELDHEEQLKHQELEVAQEIYMNSEEGEEESELNKELSDAEIDENEDPQEELEEILEEISEIEQEEEQELWEKAKEQELEQEKEEEWLKYLVNWVKEESNEEIGRQFKEELIETSEKYDELDELTTRFQELYQKEQIELLSRAEKEELKPLTKSLLEENPERIVVFTNLRAIKRQLSHQKLEKTQINQLLKHVFTQFPPKKQINRILKANKNQLIVRILRFNPKELVDLIEQLGRKFKNIKFDVQDKTYLEKKKKFTYSSEYSDGDIEFWIELFKLKYYGGSWPKVFNLIREFNNHLNLKIGIPNFYNNMTPFVKKFFKQNGLIYEELLKKYGTHKSKQQPNDENVLEWIKIYQDREVGGSISAIRKYLENQQGYTYGETTVRRHIKKFFQKHKYAKYFGTDLSYENWMKKYKRTYFREDMPSDPMIQSHEYILLYNLKKNQYQRVFIKDLENPEPVENLDEFQILGITNELQPEKVNITRVTKGKPQESLEIICSHGSVIISPDQFLFTIDDDCNIIEIKGSELKVGMPILMPRILEIDPNHEPLDLLNCGKLVTKNSVQYIEQLGKKSYRFIKKNAKLGAILGQFEAEGTIPSKYQPTTIISVSTDYEYIQKLQKMLKELFGLEFHIQTKRVMKCKNCGSKTIEKEKQNICPKCEKGIHNEYYVLTSKTKLVKIIFTEGLGLEHAYSYLKELPSFLYNSPAECEKGFIVGYFKGDGSELDYRNKGGIFGLNFETTSRRLVLGLNLLMKKLGVIMSVGEHNPPSTRPKSKKLFSMYIRGSSNFEKLNQIFRNLPEIDYSTSDLRSSVNNQILLRKLNFELQKKYGVSLRNLCNKGIIPKNAVHIATQIKRKSNLSEVLLLKTLDGLIIENKLTPLAKKLERVFRNNTFTKIKRIKPHKPPANTYKISVDGLGHCSGTAFIYVKSKNKNK